MIRIRVKIKDILKNESTVRYIVRGLIDGSLSVLGVVIGASVSGDATTIISAGLGGGIANGLSNILGALTAERASLERERIQKEKSLLKNKGYLKKSILYKKAINECIVCGIIDGVSTTFGSVLPIIPFFVFKITLALYISILITILLLFILGIYIGRISHENIIISGLKLVVGALLVSALCFMIEWLL
ncbi:TIGR00267 family protein [Methanocaldococcus indicus]|uniref:TIGR00267 family protein n=1 Tax=Methanocaldococcus indicus TaxID=213231 RepID=UPI003C6D1029